MRKHLYTLLIFCLVLALDAATKHVVETEIALHERINVIGSFVQLTLLYNRGGLFGIMQGYQTFFLVVSVAVFTLLVAYYFLEREKTTLFRCAMALIMAGAVGNIADRLLGKPGVVDFIYIGSDEVFRWPAFNVADSSIVAGALLLLLFYFLEERKKKTAGAGDQ